MWTGLGCSTCRRVVLSTGEVSERVSYALSSLGRERVTAPESSQQSFARLTEIAARHQIDVDIHIGGSRPPKWNSRQETYTGVIIVPDYEYKVSDVRSLWVDLQALVKQGRRLVFLAQAGITNDLADLFGVSLSYEDNLTPGGQDALSVPGDKLCRLWSGLEVGAKHLDHVQLKTFFGSLEPSQDVTIMSTSQGQKKMSVHGKLGSGEYLFMASFVSGWSDRNLFQDSQIDGWDNAVALERLLDWLVGRIGYDAFSKGAAAPDPRPAQVTDEHIKRFRLLQEELARGQVDQREAESSLNSLAVQVGKAGFAWIMRQMPLYDARNQRWIPLNEYAKDLGKQGAVRQDSRLASDPVRTGVDLMFGNPSSGQILNWLGFE